MKNNKNNIFIILNLIFSIVSKNNIIFNRILNEEEEPEIIELILNVTEEGEQGILNRDFLFKPNYVYSNETLMNLTNNYTISLQPNLYKIKLIWYSKLTSLQFLFSDLSNIIEIDFSNFNT